MLQVEVPPEQVKVTVCPPDSMSFPLASFTCSVAFTVEAEATVAEEIVTTDCAFDEAPTVTVTVGNAVDTFTPDILP